MPGHSLLRRIREPELAAPRRVVSDDEVRQAVAEHLGAMFQTRIGSAVGASDYGITSITDIVHSCPDAIDDILKSIRATVKKYEPRIVSFQVKHISGAELRDATIRFELSGEIQNGSRKTPFKVHTIIDAKRSVRLETV